MPYTINRYAGQQLTQVSDATIDDTTCDIKLIGRNYAGYGEAQNENFVFLLENFARETQPNNPLTGQIWYDTATNKLKFYDGNIFMPTARMQISNVAPTYASKMVGDLWFNSDSEQLFAWTGTTFTLVGPEGSSKMKVVTVLDTLDNEHIIIEAVLNEEVIFIISSEKFELNSSNPIIGFDEIHDGVTLINTKKSTNGITSTTHRYWGTASNADKVGGQTLENLDGRFHPKNGNNSLSLSASYLSASYLKVTENASIPANPEGIIRYNDNSFQGHNGTKWIHFGIEDQITPVENGGTGLSSYNVGDIIYASATNVLSKLGKDNGKFLRSTNSGIEWANIPPGTGMIYPESGVVISSGNSWNDSLSFTNSSMKFIQSTGNGLRWNDPMIYPGVGIPVSDGNEWSESLSFTNSSGKYIKSTGNSIVWDYPMKWPGQGVPLAGNGTWEVSAPVTTAYADYFLKCTGTGITWAPIPSSISYPTAGVVISTGNTWNTSLAITSNSTGKYIRSTGSGLEWHDITINLDADTLDGLNSTQFLRSDEPDTWVYSNSESNINLTGILLNYDLSGTTALTANRTKTALSIDLDHTSTGGTATDGQRETLYGGNFDVLTSGTPYAAYGIYGHVRSANTTGTIGTIVGVRGYAEGDSGTGGTNTSVYGVQGDARDGGAGAVSNVYGGSFYVLKETGATTVLENAIGSKSEVEIDRNSITNAYAAQHIIDIDGGTLTNSYLTYGAYEGTIQSGCWSAYYPSNAPNYFLGEVRIGSGTQDLGNSKLQVNSLQTINSSIYGIDNQVTSTNAPLTTDRSLTGIRNQVILTYENDANYTVTGYGALNYAILDAASGNSLDGEGVLFGSRNEAANLSTHASKNKIESAYGNYNIVRSNGNTSFIDNAYGSYNYVVSEADGSEITKGYGTYSTVKANIAPNISTGTPGSEINTGYLYYGTFTGSGTITNKYGIYIASTCNNYLSTGLQIGGTTVATGTGLKGLGVGTQPPDTDGEILATGMITAGYSDERLKTFQGTITNAINKVNQLNGYYFTENQTAKDLGYSNNRLQVGLSAQEVEQVLPEVVTDAPIKNDQGYKTIWYERLVPLLIEAVKEQQAIIDTTKSSLDSMKEEYDSVITELKNEIKLLKMR